MTTDITRCTNRNCPFECRRKEQGGSEYQSSSDFEIKDGICEYRLEYKQLK